MADPNFLVRRAEHRERDEIQNLVQIVADETFSHLFPGPHVTIGEVDWSSSWVPVSNSRILGVTLTREEYVTDLWVVVDWRRRGVGGSLLAQSEGEIRTRGHSTARLRAVKSNPAVQFYLRCSWIIKREFPHEKSNHMMFEITKVL